MNNNPIEFNQNTKNSNEINDLNDFLVFLSGGWRNIVVCCLIGLASSGIYFILVPEQYEATAQVRLAEIGQAKSNGPFGTPIEDVASLISRMQFPTSYPPEVIAVCGYKDDSNINSWLKKTFKFSALKGVPNTVELKVLSSSPQGAVTCADAVFERMRTIQEEFSRPLIEEAVAKVALDNERIDAARKLISKADQSGAAMSASYLSARDELTYFLTDREEMMDLINSAKTRGTRLLSPIYANENPVAPKRWFVIAIGLLSGFVFGLLITLFKNFRKNRNY